MTIRWGIIRCGAVCEVKSRRESQDIPGSERTAVMRRYADKAADCAERHGAGRWTDQTEAIACVDDVCIATPVGSHAGYVLTAAETV